MPHTKSGIKSLRQNMRRRSLNQRRARTLRLAEKELERLIREGKTSDASAYLPRFFQAADKAAKRGVIKRHTAARKKSRSIRRLHVQEGVTQSRKEN